jgi:hypothetical protein
MLNPAPRPPRQSFLLGPSTVFWVAVTACTVVIRPSSIPQLSCTTFVIGARQLVVQLALLTMSIDDLYSSWLTPMTNMGASGEGALMITCSGQGRRQAGQEAGRQASPCEITYQGEGASRRKGHRNLTFSAPFFICAAAASILVKAPVDSTT